jgi:hypothetical protein
MDNSREEQILNEYLSVYDEQVRDICLKLRSFVAKSQPDANQLIYDGYNAVSIVFSLSDKMRDAFCHLAVYKNHVNFGFNRGAEIKNPDLKLEGKGKLIRHYKVNDLKNLPKEELSMLLEKALKISLLKKTNSKSEIPTSKIFIKPTSGKKLRP